MKRGLGMLVKNRTTAALEREGRRVGGREGGQRAGRPDRMPGRQGNNLVTLVQCSLPKQ